MARRSARNGRASRASATWPARTRDRATAIFRSSSRWAWAFRTWRSASRSSRARARPAPAAAFPTRSASRHACTNEFEFGGTLMKAKLIDVTGARAAPLDLWEPVIVTREEIAAEAARLADLPRPANGRRETMLVHPQATAPGLGLAPGIRV